MENHLTPGDPVLVANIVKYLKVKGIFDEFRHECLADIDTKSSFQNLSQRSDGYTGKFLASKTWTPDLNKNEVRNELRRHIDESEMITVGLDHVVEQVINPKIPLLFPKVVDGLHQYLAEVNENLNKKQEIINSEKISTETISKTKTTVLDPIADILSFTCSKPKPVVSSPVQNAPPKVSETSKVEKKKEVAYPTKLPDPTPKIEKKKEEVSQQLKTPDIMPKVKKEEVSQPAKTADIMPKVKKEVSHPPKTPDIMPKVKKEEVSQPAKTPDIMPKAKREDVSDQTLSAGIVLISERNEDVFSPIKTESVELSKDLPPVTTAPKTKSLNDVKDFEKVVKVKMEDSEVDFEIPKNLEQEEAKYEKKKVDCLKLKIPEKLLQPEENNETKSSPSVKSSSSSKSKIESAKHKKNRPLGLGVVKNSSQIEESSKSSFRESSDSSSDKTTADQSKVSTKLPSVHSKDRSLSLKNTISAMMVKCEKGGDKGEKIKPKGTPTKSGDKPASLKVGSLKREDSSDKLKRSSEKQEKTKTLKTSDSKLEARIQSESSSSSDKGSKESSHYSSFNESSQGSDPERSSSSVSSRERLKHFSKHQKDSLSADSTDKPSSDKKQPDSDSGTPTKSKSQKGSKHPTKDQKKSFTVQESAKISFRSDSIGSVSSTSDSQASLKESSVSISSGETSDSSSKNSKKKKTTLKGKEPCSLLQNLPPPSPPPPTSGLSISSSAEMSSMDDTQSSQESQFESSGDEVSSESDEENFGGSSSNQELSLKATELYSDVRNVFLFSSSSSEFEGFNSSPEKAPRSEKFAPDDVSVSSVHTSDLSSFEDELSDVECLGDESEEGKSKKRFTIKEAEEILKAKAEQQRLDALKAVSQKAFDDNKNTSNPQNSATAVILAEVPPPPEPKRESRRERKLNPKYASSEYTSIFDSKRTSFITKPSPLNEVKPGDTKKTDSYLLTPKDTTPTKRKSSVTTPNKYLANDTRSKVPSEDSGNLISLPSASSGSVVLKFSVEDISQTKTTLDKSLNTHSDTESPNRIALKIKLSASKNDNETNKDPNGQSTKRKVEDKEKGSAKTVCQHKPVNPSSLESIANENKPFNSESKHSLSNAKEIFHKQKVNNNNGDVLNKIEHVRRNSRSKPNHVNEQ